MVKVTQGHQAREPQLRTRVRQAADAGALAAQAAGTATDPLGTPDNPCDRILTLANLITVCRLALTIAFLVLFVGRRHRALAVACYVIAALTDFLDGQVARRTQTVSWFGKVMDPIMDRVLLFTGVLGLVLTGELPAWVALFVCGRDAALGVGALVLQRYRRRPLDVTLVGKAATALLMGGFSDLLLGVPRLRGLAVTSLSWLPGLNAQAAPVGIFLVYAGLACSTIAAVVYVRAGLAVRRAIIEERDRHVD